MKLTAKFFVFTNHKKQNYILNIAGKHYQSMQMLHGNSIFIKVLRTYNILTLLILEETIGAQLLFNTE